MCVGGPSCAQIQLYPEEESDLERKFKERPEECVIVMMFGMINTEFLCFLTPDPEEHASFRKLGLLNTLIEGLPTLALQAVWHSWWSEARPLTLCRRASLHRATRRLRHGCE